MEKLLKNTWFLLIFSAIVLILFFTLFRMIKQRKVGAAITNKNVKALLDTISYAEGTNAPNGYRYLFGSRYDNEVLFDGFNSHPKIYRPFRNTTSSAAGRYQILYRTWMWMGVGVLGLSDFSPKSQDLCAIGLINYRGALEHIIAGRFDEAIYACRKEWASLPGANYPGQGMRSIEALRNFYINAGGQIA